jgi:hypothetical protein
LLFGGPDTADTVDQPLEPAEHPVEPARPALVDARHVRSERFGERYEHYDVKDELQNSVGAHEKISGFSSATTR